MNTEMPYHDLHNMISWNSFASVQFDDEGVHSASLLLMHEFNHAFLNQTNDVKLFRSTSKRWGNANEKYATQTTNSVASDLGQGRRNSYGGGIRSYTPDVNSTTPNLTREGRYYYNMNILLAPLNPYQQQALNLFKNGN